MNKPLCFSVLFKIFIEAVLIIMAVSGHQVYAKPSRTATYYVCPQTTTNCTSIYAFNWAGLKTGDTVVIRGGNYNQPIFIYNVLNSINIINDGVSDAFINNYVAFVNSKNIVWNGRNRIHIRNTPSPGIVIVQGSSNLSITGTEITNTGLGIWISQAAGCGHDIIGNTVKNNQTHGIAIDKINCAAGTETVISNNVISGNLWHGIELNGNYYIVESNEVAWNGNGMPGTSGIHVYAATPDEGTGQHNVIRYNSSHDNSDINGPDGNGIQLDQFTQFNEVSNNYVFNNNGAGIIVYDSSDAQVFNNTLSNNMIDALRSHLCCKANIVVTSASFFDVSLYSGSKLTNYVSNINVSGNTTISGASNAAPIFVDPVSLANNVQIEANIAQ